MPVYLVGVAGRLEMCKSRASLDLTGKILLPDEGTVPQNISDEIDQRMMEIVRHLQTNDCQNDNTPFWLEAHKLWQTIEERYFTQHSIDGLHAIRESIIINAWASIESALEQLWDLAESTVHDVKSRNGDERRIVCIADTKGVRFTRIYSQKGKERLKSMAVIRETYARGFSVDAAAIDDALSEPALDSLANVRHLLVHKCGVMDPEYIAKAPLLRPLSKWFDPTVAKIFIPPEMLVDLITGALTATIGVIKSVDQWIDTHP